MLRSGWYRSATIENSSVGASVPSSTAHDADLPELVAHVDGKHVRRVTLGLGLGEPGEVEELGDRLAVGRLRVARRDERLAQGGVDDVLVQRHLGYAAEGQQGGAQADLTLRVFRQADGTVGKGEADQDLVGIGLVRVEDPVDGQVAVPDGQGPGVLAARGGVDGPAVTPVHHVLAVAAGRTFGTVAVHLRVDVPRGEAASDVRQRVGQPVHERALGAHPCSSAVTGSDAATVRHGLRPSNR